MGTYRSGVVVSFPPWIVCQQEGIEMSKNKKQSGDKEESILNGLNGFSEKLWSTGC